jgi:hypothetical protein
VPESFYQTRMRTHRFNRPQMKWLVSASLRFQPENGSTRETSRNAEMSTSSSTYSAREKRLLRTALNDLEQVGADDIKGAAENQENDYECKHNGHGRVFHCSRIIRQVGRLRHLGFPHSSQSRNSRPHQQAKKRAAIGGTLRD